MAKATGRIPLFVAKGTHFDIGLQVGREYHHQIRYYVNHHDWLEKYEVFHKTPEGAKFCKSFWEVWDKHFPQYVEELKGLAEGASVELLQIKLLHIERELAVHMKLFEKHFIEAPKGCTDVLVANDKNTIIGHNEDWISNMIGRDILLLAHILPWTAPDGRTFPEEKFLVHTWPGLLPGMNSGFTKNGLVFSIDHLFPKKASQGKLADLVLCRHVLTAKNLQEVTSILEDDGRGVAVGFTINIGFRGSKTLHSFELGPSGKGSKTPLHRTTIEPKAQTSYAHFNNYEHLKDVDALSLELCLDRRRCWNSLSSVVDVKSVRDALGNDSSKKYPIFQKYVESQPSCTVATVILDIGKEKMSFFQDNPRDADPLICLPFSVLDTTCA